MDLLKVEGQASKREVRQLLEKLRKELQQEKAAFGSILGGKGYSRSGGRKRLCCKSGHMSGRIKFLSHDLHALRLWLRSQMDTQHAATKAQRVNPAWPSISSYFDPTHPHVAAYTSRLVFLLFLPFI